MAENSQRVNVSDQIAAKIKDYILANDLHAGDRLPTEHELAEKFGVSRISVREATKSLGFLGIIDAAPRRGLTIGNLNMERVSQYLGFHFAISSYPEDQLIDTRAAIELGGLARTAANMQQDADIYKRLKERNDHLRAIHETADQEVWIASDVEFHRELLRASGLEPLLAFHELLLVFFQRFRRGMKLEYRASSIGQHQEVIDALKAGDVELARKHLQNHVETNRGRM